MYICMYAGFHTEGGGGPGISPPPPGNLEIEYGYYWGAINISYLIFMLKYQIAAQKEPA